MSGGKLRTGEEMWLSATAPPELEAFAEVLKIAVPGLKMPPMTVAATMQRMLLKRGVVLAPAPGKDADV